MKHTLKIEDTYYDQIFEGDKKFEVRFNDRGYQKGDEIEFTDVYGGIEHDGIWKIIYVHSGLGMAEGYVVLGIERKP